MLSGPAPAAVFRAARRGGTAAASLALVKLRLNNHYGVIAQACWCQFLGANSAQMFS